MHVQDKGPTTHEIDRDLQEKLRKIRLVISTLFIEIKKQFGFDVEFDYDLTIPAFHVFGGKKIELAAWNFHTDMGILDYYPNINPAMVVSFACLIESPRDDEIFISMMIFGNTKNKLNTKKDAFTFVSSPIESESFL